MDHEQAARILSVHFPCSASALKSAYYQAMLRHHPDRSEGDRDNHEIAVSINLAYDFLTKTRLPVSPPISSRKHSSPSSERKSYKPHPPRPEYDRGFPDPKVVEIYVESSHILSLGYNGKKHILYIKFRRDRKVEIYRYFSVPDSVFRAMLDAPSKGKFANRYIHKVYKYERC